MSITPCKNKKSSYYFKNFYILYTRVFVVVLYKTNQTPIKYSFTIEATAVNKNSKEIKNKQ